MYNEHIRYKMYIFEIYYKLKFIFTKLNYLGTYALEI